MYVNGWINEQIHIICKQLALPSWSFLCVVSRLSLSFCSCASLYLLLGRASPPLVSIDVSTSNPHLAELPR